MTQTNTKIIQSVVDGVIQARSGTHPACCVYRLAELCESKNQYCLFLKPGISDPGTDFRAIMELVLGKIESHDLRIEEVVILPGWFLERHQVMPQHYGTLNSLARNAATNMSDAMRREFRASFGVDVEEVTVLGGFEFLERFPDVSPFALELLWENTEQHRLGRGSFCGKVTVGNGSIFLVNGFTPNLMRMYTRAESTVVVFSICGMLSWLDARSIFVGAPDPAKAAPGSLRNELFVKRANLGLEDLRLGANGVHLSAGPVEALVELYRFMSIVSPGEARTPADFQFGRKLARTFSAREIDAILMNPTVKVSGESKSIFDLTEEMDEDAALNLLTCLRHQLLAR